MEQAEVTPHVYVLYTHRLFSGTSRRGSSDTPHVLYIYYICICIIYTGYSVEQAEGEVVIHPMLCIDTPHVMYCIYIIYVYVLYTQVTQWNKQKGK